MASSSNETYDGALEVLMKQIATMKMLPDANLPFVIELETKIIEEARNPERQMQKAGLLPPGGANPQGAGALGLPPGGGGMGMSAPPPSQLGAGAPAGVMQSPAGPANADEMRRVLTAPGT